MPKGEKTEPSKFKSVENEKRSILNRIECFALYVLIVKQHFENKLVHRIHVDLKRSFSAFETLFTR